jgi:hypothetical protein
MPSFVSISSSSQVILRLFNAFTILEAEVLVLLIGGIYEVLSRDGSMWHCHTHTKFHEDWLLTGGHTDTQTARRSHNSTFIV